MKSKSGIFTNVLVLIIGILAGWIIANHYYKESNEDRKEALIENGIHEIELNLTHKVYEEYQDTMKYLGAGKPFSYLQDGALNQLYLNLMVFKDSDSSLFAAFESKLIAAKINVGLFNEDVRFRNNYILVDLKNVKTFNPLLFGNYYEYVEPSLQTLKKFLIENKESLVG